MQVSQKRAENVSLAGLLLSILFFVILILLGWWSRYFAMSAIGWLMGAAVLIWFVLLLQFHQRRLAEQEKLDMSRISDQSRPTIFEKGGEQEQLLATAQKRLNILEKYFLPIFSGIIATYQLGIGIYLLQILLKGDAAFKPAQLTNQPQICIVALAAIALVSFLISRYATGLSTESAWRPLKAGGAILVCCAVAAFLLAIAFTFVYFNFFAVILTICSWLIPVLLIILGCETALNIILDLYRPRLKEVYSRAAFDSRLLAVINEPGGILQSVASAIDYQFGFKVSQTWFYRLLEKAIVPLVLFGAVSIYLLSSIAVIGPEEQAVVEHFGKAVKDGNTVKIYEPGIVLKWPWPIDRVRKYPTRRIMELSIGFVQEIDPKTGQPVKGPRLWDRPHYKEEYQLLVSTGEAGKEEKTGETPMKIILASVPVQYKVKDIYSFLYKYGMYEKSDRSRGYWAEKMLESICYRELTRFAAGATIDLNSEKDFAVSLLGGGLSAAGRELKSAIQKAADDAGVGAEIIFVGMQGIHPPIELAGDYESVVGAIKRKQAAILNAEAARNITLTSLAGSIEKAEKLYELLAQQYQQGETGLSEQSAKAKALEGQIDEAFNQSGGKIFATLREAQSYAYQRATTALADGERFAGQVAAYRASPQINKRWLILTALENGLKNIRKYVVISDKNNYIIQEIDAVEKLIPELSKMLGYGEK